MEEVFWCRICQTNRKLSCIHEPLFGCNVCGLVLRAIDFTPEPLPKERHPVLNCARSLGIFDDYTIEDAKLYYKEASSCGYFESRNLEALCLYIASRTCKVPVMFVELELGYVSVYDVGMRFLDLCCFLSDEIDGFEMPEFVDPVFFIHRFTVALLKENKFVVVLTALRILAAFKSDYVGCWKRLGGLCAAAVYMAAEFNGFDVLDFDDAFRGVVSEKLVKSRIEDLYVEFASVAQEYDYTKRLFVDSHCPHNVEKFRHHFCHVCYDKFVKLSGYFCGGLDAKKCRECWPAELENGIAVPREEENVLVLCGKKRLSSMINFDVLREAFGDDEAQSTNTKSKEFNGSSNAMEQGQAREENLGDKLAIGGDAQGREDLVNKDDRREKVLANKNNSARRRFGQPKRPWVRRSASQR